MWAAVGIHPHDAGKGDATALAEIERLAGEPRVVAVGEIGLDYFRDLSPREDQERVFRALLGLARRLGKPVVVHCRDAHEDVLRILGEERVAEVGGIMHCFSGDVAIARRCLDLGLLISLAGPVTYPNARALPDVARFVPGRPPRDRDRLPVPAAAGPPRPAQRAGVRRDHRGPSGRAARRTPRRLGRHG